MSQTDTSDLSQRIMDAWLEVNPEPEDGGDWSIWIENQHKLSQLLTLGAYESAVIQFLLPVGTTYETGNYLFNEAILQVGDETISSCSNASSVAEALLNAIISSRQEK